MQWRGAVAFNREDMAFGSCSPTRETRGEKKMSMRSTIPDLNQRVSLSEDVMLDLPALIETRAVIQANSGGGKSWAIRRLLEQSHGRVQHIVIDVEGSFRTLREHYEYVLVGSETDEVDYPL